MSTHIKGRELKVVHGVAAPESTAQTPGMIRKPGIDSNTAGAEKIWLGHVECVPNTMGPPHNHGEAETAAYVLKGHIRVYYGEDYKEYIEAGPRRLHLRSRPLSTTSKETPTTSLPKRSCREARTTS